MAWQFHIRRARYLGAFGNYRGSFTDLGSLIEFPNEPYMKELGKDIIITGLGARPSQDKNLPRLCKGCVLIAVVASHHFDLN